MGERIAPFPDEVPPELQRLIRSFVRRRRLVFFVRRLALSVAFICGWLIVSSVADRVEPITRGVRVPTESFIAIVVATILTPSAARLFRKIDSIKAAAQLDSRDARFGGVLETIVSQVSRSMPHRGSAALLSVLRQRAVESAREVSIRSLVPLTPARRPIIAAGVLLATVSILSSVERFRMPALFAREIFSWADVPPVTFTSLQVSPGNVTRRIGRPFTVIASVGGGANAVPQLEYRAGNDAFETMPMTLGGRDYEFRFSSLDETLQYRVIAGDAASPLYTVKLDQSSSGNTRKTERDKSRNLLTPSAGLSRDEEAYLRAIASPDASPDSVHQASPISRTTAPASD